MKMKFTRDAPGYSESDHQLNLLKALVQFSIQVESQEIDLKGLLKPSKSSLKEEANEDSPRKSRSALQEENGHSRSSSTEVKGDRMLLKRYWRRPAALRRTQKTIKPTIESETPVETLISTQMSLQQQLAITALNLTAPACSTVLRNHKNNFVQLSGHPGSLAPAGPGTIWKKQPGDTNETWVYEALTKDSAKDIVPKFYREVLYEGKKFIEISDLLYNFNNPSMMDIKIGSRTFLESEVTNTKARTDLYDKMIKVDPDAPTEEERETRSITKLRYMNFRDMLSSSRSLSFRIEALKMSNSSSVTELKKIRTDEEVVDVLTSFVQRRESVKKQFISRLKVIRDTFQDSQFFQNHEVIGSSILFVYDDNQVGAWVIDFAKTCKLPEGVAVTHRKPWEPGNHEEGYLTGIDNLIKCFEGAAVQKSRRMKFFGKS